MKIVDYDLLTISENGLQIVGKVLGNEESSQILICCHGFGVTSDSWGMYKTICEHFKEKYLTIRFNFVSVDEFVRTTYVHEYSKQVEKLKTVIDRVNKKYPNRTITIIGHSQGTFIPPLFLKMYNSKIDKLILLAPPATSDIALKMKEYFEKRPGTKIDTSGKTVLERSDGSTTIVPSEFWSEAGLIDPTSLFKHVDDNYNTYFVWAKNDPVLTNKEYEAIKSITPTNFVELDGDHDFKNDNWKKLIEYLDGIL
ncbi:alpha/beta fold hydrolase [Candidatus Dojkabacteria bacterium]|nr:alpha/beta fold hydrolase [Candidatus Dojkabacteria bacterium]